MARIQLTSEAKAAQRRARARRPERVRIGALSIFALVIVISLSVLAVLALSTSHASLAMSERQALSETQRYLDEAAAQEFVAALDEQLAGLRAKGGADRALPKDSLHKLEADLERMCADACAAVSGDVTGSATLQNNQVHAQFSCGNGRKLELVATLGNDATFQIEQWKMSAVQNQEAPKGTLLVVD